MGEATPKKKCLVTNNADLAAPLETLIEFKLELEVGIVRCYLAVVRGSSEMI